MLGLREQIGGDEVSVPPPVARNQHLGRPRGPMSIAQSFETMRLVAAVDVAIPGATDLVHARGWRGVPYANAPMGLRARRSRAISFTPRISAAASKRRTRLRASHDNAVNTGDLRRDRGHQQCGKISEKKRPAGNSNTRWFPERSDALSNAARPASNCDCP